MSASVPESFDTDTEAKGKHAAKFLCHAERLLKGADPFLWALIRPPWSKNGTCCKATVFRLLKELGSNSQVSWRKKLLAKVVKGKTMNFSL